MVGTLLLIIILVVVGFGILIVANSSSEAKEREKRANEQRKQEYQDRIDKLKPDYVLGGIENPTFIKGNTFINDKYEINLSNSFYAYSDGDIFVFFTKDKNLDWAIFSYPVEEEEKVVKALEKNGAKKWKSRFVISKNNESQLGGSVEFRNEEEYAYFVDDTKWFRISGQKDNNMRWRLIGIEFTPQFVSDYDVETTSEENGRISGNLGAAAIGGAVAGTAGAVVGSSLGRKTQSTTVTHYVNSAKVREIPATVILTIEDKNGEKTKISDKWYEEDVTFAKTRALVDISEENEKTSLTSEIKKLQSLLNDGVITEEEFIKGKNKILEE